MTNQNEDHLRIHSEAADRAGDLLRDLMVQLNQAGFSAEAIITGMHAEMMLQAVKIFGAPSAEALCTIALQHIRNLPAYEAGSLAVMPVRGSA